MPKTLVLAEKPSVAKELARVLGCRRGGEGYMEGDGYVVTWALGHLVTLADPESYDARYKKWDMADLPMLPEKMKLTVIKESSRQFRVVQALMDRGDVADMVIATDSGREGELVARWIMRQAGWKKPAKRLWISSQTDRAIREGFAALRPASEYDNLYKSAEARSKADWLVGLNVTRALTCRYNASLSAGRVQTPTLALIVEREEEIKKFIPKNFYNVEIKTPGFTALWKDKSNQSRLYDMAAAQRIAAAAEGKQAVIAEVTKTYKQKAPPAAYDLTELQRDANKKYAYSAKETLDIMQSLYERHKVLTYPRTDSRYISDDVVATLPERLRAVAVGEYAELAKEALRAKPLSTRYIVNNAKVTDHHAIIPTEERPDFVHMTGPERNIYDMVVRRFLAVLMPPFEYEEVKLKLTVGGENFYARGKTVKALGWRAAYDKSVSDEEEEETEDDREQALPPLKQGDKVPVLSAAVKTGKTRPPARYTEATLLTAMEHPRGQVSDREFSRILEETSGLGTPATRADIIEKLFSSFYIERRGKELVPTGKGVQLVNIVPPELRSAELTAKWEQKLAEIARGRLRDEDFVGEMRRYATALVANVRASDAKFTHDNVTREKCPECGKFLLDVKGKKGNMLVCPDRECGYRRSVAVQTNARCPNCHKKLDLRGEGEGRMFVCVCGYREKLSDFEKRRASDGANKGDVRRYLETQKEEKSTSALAEQLAKWQEAQKKN